MSLESDIRSALLDMSAVTTLVGSGSSARIRSDALYPTDTLPAIVIEVDGYEHSNDLTGFGGLVFAKVVLTCRASTRDGAWTLAEAVRRNGTSPGTGLAGYSGAFDALLESQVAARVPKDDGSSGWWYDVVQDYTMSRSETT
jgi:hypothetical protein